MIISENLLEAYGAEYVKYESGKEIFHEGGAPQYYFQIVSGIIELNNYHEDGKEFTHNILSEGQCFGESLLFNDKPYPMNAVAKTDCEILKLSKKKLLRLLMSIPQASLDMYKCLADRLYYKYIMQFGSSNIDPASKIITVMDYYKQYNSKKGRYAYRLPLTRQQLANLTGLRVETIIRTVKKLDNEKKLLIKNGKIYY